MTTETEQVIEKKCKIALKKNITSTHLQIDDVVIAYIYREGVFKIDLDALETLGIRAKASFAENGARVVSNIGKLLVPY